MKNQILTGNCVNVLNALPSGIVDLVITSPPYDNLRDYKGYSFEFEAVAEALKRILKPGGVIVWIVADATIKGSETGTSFYHALYFKELGLNLHDTMIYKKKAVPFPSSNRYTQVFEYMFIFSKGKPKTTNIIKDRKNNWGGTSTFGKVNKRLKDGTLKVGKQKIIAEYGSRYNVWEIDCGKGKSSKDSIAYAHPAIFPESLAGDHILTWSNPGDLVLDPMCGSGTTLKMAVVYKRNYLGIDISSEYCEIAKKRIKSVLEKEEK